MLMQTFLKSEEPSLEVLVGYRRKKYNNFENYNSSNTNTNIFNKKNNKCECCLIQKNNQNVFKDIRS